MEVWVKGREHTVAKGGPAKGRPHARERRIILVDDPAVVLEVLAQRLVDGDVVRAHMHAVHLAP